MRHRTLLQAGAITLALLALTMPVSAGGWAVVTLDSLPAQPQAGETLHLGFMVRQHGKTPIDWVEPYLSARNTETGATLRTDARKDGPVGHFTVDVTFPSSGAWELQITPEPFGPTELGQVAVQPAAQSATSQGAVVTRPMFAPSLLLGAGVALVLAAIALAVVGRRGGVRGRAVKAG